MRHVVTPLCGLAALLLGIQDVAAQTHETLCDAGSLGEVATDPATTRRARDAMKTLGERGFRGSILVSHRDSILLHDDFNVSHAKPVIRYEVASITKTLTTIGILKLIETGDVDFDDTLSRFFEDVPPDKRAITIYDLLIHRSGLPQTYAAEGTADRDRAVAAVLAQPLEHPPGTDFTYTNDGYSLLAAVIEVASGQPYREYLRQVIAERLGIEPIAFWPDAMRPDEWVPPLLHPRTRPVDGTDWGSLGGHGARLSVRELHAIGTGLMQGDLLSVESVAFLIGPHHTTRSGIGVGMGWFTEIDDAGRRLSWTRGSDSSGANAILYFVEDDLLVIAATNAGPEEGTGPGWSREARDALIDIYAACSAP